MKKFLLLLTLVFSAVSCIQDLDELEKYTPPPWLKGKLYTQIEAQAELGKFAEALKITGLDTIINTSGLFTVFAPSDEAFTLFFQDNPSYSGEVSSIPMDELKNLVSFHIIQNSWSMRQLATLNISGWIDEDEDDVRSRAFKKETFLRAANKEYFVDEDQNIYLNKIMKQRDHR